MPSADSRPSTWPWLLASRVFAVLTVAVVVVLFGTAGRLVQAHQLEDFHGAAAIALHVVSGGLLVALAGLAYERRRGWWAAALACALLVYSFVQAALGESEMLSLHIPGALAVSAATFWLTAWLFFGWRDR
ncbi:hypothetical protein [Mycolicibacterium vaccae]|uniref:Integral membrane protein n=1 Tax=Mycolicibacterium vaccae ATCC 25954 TaxID=1194972 RepID=K0VLR2_MYCVA|nr:hypothetical protein [Mycolicibacterium vaccae]ANI41630.1 hypothetical protein MYVA_4545 [Mycolicibacterium vaccae 95051]EJZ12049.1 hypothetical protein MVAC_03896 [Mycolicibacterium vaccae ATCC 25954]MCV7061833.1 hypothetical protein [Mycolicibacterium vaccae]